MKPNLNFLSIQMIIHTFWLEVEKNQKNLEDVHLWDFG